MEEKIRNRIKYLLKRIKTLEDREKYYEQLNKTDIGYISLGRIRGDILSKEMEISFLESLL
ncbi:hypothetical protein PDQ70_16400 [Bacillus cereus group sp. Bc011]|uniref:hypothetical protein n=1 Tax=unclassified Bacillus cereus group TaxID=2750818 RepID=UPI0022E98684|nr:MULTISPECIES: hypothetical protein [unclassified Bacillus cereus group]MDA2681063.1 hypothetical protein [Bacillus cereus group sp. Bc029]MDA2742039.1 hypothetical protein [Bacillus cereus group sp. Bc011]